MAGLNAMLTEIFLDFNIFKTFETQNKNNNKFKNGPYCCEIILSNKTKNFANEYFKQMEIIDENIQELLVSNLHV